MRYGRTLPSGCGLSVVIPNCRSAGFNLAEAHDAHIFASMNNFPKAPPEKNETRYILCQMAVETVLQDLVEEARREGWEETEVLSAITDVSDHLMLAAAANRELESLLVTLRQNRPTDGM